MRRMSAIMASVLGFGFVVGLGFTVALLIRAPGVAWLLAAVYVAATVGMTWLIGEGLVPGAICGAVVTVFTGGAIALHELFGLSVRTVVAVFGMFLVLLLATIGRAIISAGAADPYDG
jgi:hypothetical protein